MTNDKCLFTTPAKAACSRQQNRGEIPTVAPLMVIMLQPSFATHTSTIRWRKHDSN